MRVAAVARNPRSVISTKSIDRVTGLVTMPTVSSPSSDKLPSDHFRAPGPCARNVISG
jgi:hypothetical protein